MNKPLLEDRLGRIRLLLTDVDGVLTDGRISRSRSGDELKFFSIHDGFGIRLAQGNGIEIGFISGRKSHQVAERARELGVQLLVEGCSDKLKAFEELCREQGLSPEEVAYLGDDLPDVRLLRRVGFSAAPHNAVDAVKAVVDYVAESRGGEGALREVVELLLGVQGKWEGILRKFGAQD